ncbi:twin arginine translocase protein A [Pseudobythopirellula maris]|uniref:Twin arginine translocase protein A n=1 Tax=Pseudobythopirellula maris TaxID=2527991 RepID=A0A5C5ZI06_9BACT|nr:twin-arginine translocase TatA/TatE family subunit [Pseudobythopirellula maris]TWT86627.1 twin arginine translocase protein A [Pseudobythopirellula maris]
MLIETLTDTPRLCLAFFAGAPGPVEMLFVGAIAVLLFGNRLPSVARSVGRSLTEFKNGMRDIQDDMHSAIKADEVKAPPATAADTIGASDDGSHDHDTLGDSDPAGNSAEPVPAKAD